MIKIIIISWNVRGANNGEKRNLIKALIKSQKVDLICLQETKLKGVLNKLVRSLGVGRCMDWVASNVKGPSGGIIFFWDSRVLRLIEMEESRFSLSCKFKNCEDNFTWVFIGVYGPTSRENGESLWEELGAIRGMWGEPWCLGGTSMSCAFLRRGTKKAE